MVLGTICYFTTPQNYANFIEPNFVNRFNNRNLELNITPLYMPTSYMTNANVFGQNLRVKPNNKSKELLPVVSSGEIEGLDTKIKNIAQKYPNMQAGIYVFDYSTGKTFEYNAQTPMAVASMIKIPILFEYFRKYQQNSEDLKPNREIVFENYHKTSGSGSLQYVGTGGTYTLDYMANLMITQSDNSATNLILDYTGGKEAINSAFRRWGLNHSRMMNWLPDLNGTNKMTAKDIGTILYNLDNPKFIKPESKEYIRKYMSNLPTKKLLRAGIPDNATILHKTGDIKTALGDSGIITLSNGQKYIITTIIKRPSNDYKARDMIEEISKAVYEAVKQ